MSRYYPSRGSGRGRGGGGYYQSSSYGRGGGGGGGYYDSHGGSSGGGQGRYYDRREDRRESGSGVPSSHRAQLEIAKKLVDTLMQSQGGRRSGDHYSSGEPPYKRSRDESYDRDRSVRSRHGDYHHGHSRRDDYGERRRHDDYGSQRRPYRSRGYAPRRGSGYTRGGRRAYGDYDDEPRERVSSSRRDDTRSHSGQKQVVTKCPHCHARCATFADYRKHQLGRDHMAAMRRVLMKIRAELSKMRLAQREEQKQLEEAEQAKDPDEWEAKPSQFCTLCRLQYKDIEGIVHNETEWHRKQRTYQNPSCKTCNMTFPARIAYEKHAGTFTHIQKMTQQERRAERRYAADLQKGDFMTLDSVGDVDEDGDKEPGERGEDGEELPPRSATEKLAELGEFDGKQAVGSSYMRKTEVYHCGLCDIYIKITAKVNAVLIKHCMGKKHFENYRKKLAKLSEKEEEERKAKEAEAEAEAEAKAKEEEAAAEQTAEAAKPNGGEASGGGGGGASEAGREEDKSSAAWEQMDDNFILGDDQEEETAEKRTVTTE